MTSLDVIYGLGPPIKNPGYAYAPRTLKSNQLSFFCQLDFYFLCAALLQIKLKLFIHSLSENGRNISNIAEL